MRIMTGKVWVLFCLGFVVLPRISAAWQTASRECPYLDGGRPAAYELSMGYTPDADTSRSGAKYGQLEILSAADIAYFHNIAYGDLGLAVRFDNVFPLRKDAFRAPSQLVVLALEASWIWRYVNRTALELKFEPGFYSSTEDLLDMPLAMPITVAGVYTWDSTLALIGGVQVRPGFNDLWVPYGGAVWQPHPQFRLEAMIPDSRMTVHLDREWSGYAGLSWDSTTYHIDSDWASRDRLTLKTQELYFGVTRALSEELRVSASLGWTLDRHARLTRSRSGNPDTIDIDNMAVLRFGVSGAF